MISHDARARLFLSQKRGHTGLGKENIARHRRRRALSPHSLLLHPNSNWRAIPGTRTKRLIMLEE